MCEGESLVRCEWDKASALRNTLPFTPDALRFCARD
jgi:hypothetical protein